MTTKERFMKYVEKTPGCWFWTGFKTPDNYGRFQLGDKSKYAHRVSHELFNGFIPEGFHVDHVCFVTDCVNPAHLRAIPASLNVRLQRSSFATHCRRGHPFSPENTIWATSRFGKYRKCRTCGQARQREYLARKRLQTGVR